MADWINRQWRPLLKSPWSSYGNDKPLLFKLAWHDDHLHFLATDLNEVYFERVEETVARRRFGLGSGEQSQSQSQLNDSQRAELEDIAAAFVDMVESHQVRLVGAHEAGADLFRVTCPSCDLPISKREFRFVCNRHEQPSTVLRQHLIGPLFGLCASLLSVCKEQKVDPQSVASGIDVGGAAENAREGQSVRAFFANDGAGVGALQRWSQNYAGCSETELREFSFSGARARPQAAQRQSTPLLDRKAPSTSVSPVKEPPSSTQQSGPPSAQAISSPAASREREVAQSDHEATTEEPATESDDEPEVKATPAASSTKTEPATTSQQETREEKIAKERQAEQDRRRFLLEQQAARKRAATSGKAHGLAGAGKKRKL